MTGNRMSALPTTEFCGGYSTVTHAGGRAAAMSTAFHALSAKAEDAQAKWHRLTPEEQEEIATWHVPTTAELESGVKLHYVDADIELEIGLTPDGHCCTADDPRIMTLGHIDMAWEHEGVAYVADIKKSEWTSEVSSLQLAAYGYAYAAYGKCHSMCLGIWVADEGRWMWGPVTDLNSEEALTLWLRVKHAAQNVSSEFAVGPHCRKCYARLRCPAYQYPIGSHQELKVMAAQENMTNEQAAELLELAQRAKDTAEDVVSQLKDFASIKGPLPRQGFVFTSSLVRGRETLDREALGKVVDLKQFMKRGESYERFTWVKEK